MRGGRRYAAVVLAGGAGRRLGGAGKPELLVAGRPMLWRVLAAVADASPRIVVGPDSMALPAGVARTRERPAGGGPAAAAAAGLALLPPEVGEVALLAADLPFLTPAAVRRLRQALAAGAQAAAGDSPGGPDRAEPAGGPSGDHDGAVYVDEAGRPQWLCGVWRVPALAARLAELRAELAAGLPADLTAEPPAGLTGVPLRRLLGELRYARVSAPGHRPAPWWDCDTEDDLRQAEEWADGGAG